MQHELQCPGRPRQGLAGDAAASIRLRLRQETADLHARAETARRLKRCLEADYSLAEYIELLGALHAFHLAVESRLMLEPFEPLRRFFHARRKSHIIGLDLQSFGVCAGKTPGDSLTGLLPALHDSSARLGAAYVLEGSALGGAVIAKALRRSLGAQLAGALLFHSAGHGLAGDWRDFLTVLSDHAEEPGRAIDAAKATFQAITAWLESDAF